MILKIHQIQQIVTALQKEEVVGLPTETVYGLAGRIDSEVALKKIFAVKERPFFDPLIVHVSNVSQAQELVFEWPAIADVFTQAFWPGPLTLVLKKNNKINNLISSGLETVGLRWPRHRLTQMVLEELGVPVAAPSANKFGKTSPTTAEHVEGEFATIQPPIRILDGGACEVGVESTVVWVQGSQFSILRHGQILQRDLERALQERGVDFEYVAHIDAKHSPGHMKHHYMPSVPMYLFSEEKFSEATMSEGAVALDLSANPIEAARQLYSEMRRLSEQNPSCIYFIKKPHHHTEDWAAIIDRLTKASTKVSE